MTRAAYLDCFSGVSGNMFLGALIHAGVKPASIRKAVKRVVGDFTLAAKNEERAHMAGVHVKVGYRKKDQRHRGLPRIEEMIRKSGLPGPVISDSLRVFRALAEAEAKVHGVPVEKIHFHEVGAVDAIVDVVGTVFGLFELGVGEVHCSPLPLCGGEVQCAHGTLPLPAPAVMELVKGLPVRGMEGDLELVTPTGASLVSTLAKRFGPMPAMTVSAVGVGLGDRDIPHRPNVTRLILGEKKGEGDSVVQIEASIDDMTPESFGFLMDRLLEAGALDVSFLPCQMKKNRPATLVRALAGHGNREAVTRTLLRHSATLGVREYEVSRTVLPRSTFKVETRFGTIRVKKAEGPDGSVRLHPEYDDVAAAAAARDATMAEVSRAALEAARTGDWE